MLSSSRPGISDFDFASHSTTASKIQHLPSEADDALVLNLAGYPAIYVLPQGLSIDERKETNHILKSMRADVASSIGQARLILSFAKGAIRAKHDLASESFEDIDRFQATQEANYESAQQLSCQTKNLSETETETDHHAQPFSPENLARVSDVVLTNSSTRDDTTFTTTPAKSRTGLSWDVAKVTEGAP